VSGFDFFPLMGFWRSFDFWLKSLMAGFTLIPLFALPVFSILDDIT
jgi:hypothetical protein